MRRWLSIFFLVLLPLQFSWAAAASYCQHESGSGVRHFGHHEHVHQGASAAVDAADDNTGEAGQLFGLDDVDCASCHFGCSQPVTSCLDLPLASAPDPVWVAVLPDLLEFQWSEPIERPNWHRA
ncbi:cation efflux protein, CzcI family [Caldimonas brevitalea]|uniref:Cobalt-zinc-cadmium resistance protein n=1 Tax=Caldimonas brevitalea TaxID=413882 RepID=A0A0G3BR50_9BURK|nr:cation efflux protein, CzcI family [Caldimonas brevitalea]AKJ31899.1 cobalt-zinc-cadmium resistance protein [Caldimonas brevitalea]